MDPVDGGMRRRVVRRMPHLNYQHPFNGFGSASGLSRSPFTVHRLRVLLYGCLSVLLVATWVWAGQRSSTVVHAEQNELGQNSTTFAAARTAALRAMPGTAAELTAKGAALLPTPNRDLGLQLLEEAKHRDPLLRDTLLQIGYGHLIAATGANRSLELDAAAHALETARTLDPLYPTTYQLLAEVYSQQGKKTEAATATARANDFAAIPKLVEITRR